jgi:hypothetical protein
MHAIFGCPAAVIDWSLAIGFAAIVIAGAGAAVTGIVVCLIQWSRRKL